MLCVGPWTYKLIHGLAAWPVDLQVVTGSHGLAWDLQVRIWLWSFKLVATASGNPTCGVFSVPGSLCLFCGCTQFQAVGYSFGQSRHVVSRNMFVWLGPWTCKL